ncbi:MAG: hypothetical protein U0794_21205 [Isosphaeraceae bacterium]
MVGTGFGLPVVGLWAQAASGATAPTPADNSAAFAWLALRRWCASLTLSSPGSRFDMSGLWAWLAGLLALLVVVAIFQGPLRLLRQLVDIPGHVRLVIEATRRTRRAGRMLAVVIGSTVLAWTGSQAFVFDQASGREDLLLLTRTRSPFELAIEQGIRAGLTPLRDVAALATNLPLLALATTLLFRATAESWGASSGTFGTTLNHNPRPSGWASVGWACGALYVIYRLVSLATPTPDLPVGNCLMIEGLVVPSVMLMADGILLAWVLAELRHAGFESPDGAVIETNEAASLMPGAALACLAALPARYLATACLLIEPYLPTVVRTSAVGNWIRWQLTWGLTDVQAAALVVAGIAGAVAWTRGAPWEVIQNYRRMLATQGGRLVVVFVLAGIGAGAGAALAYFILCSLPTSTWVLNAADSYAHYATLPFGLWTLSALIELSERSLPEASLAPLEAVDLGELVDPALAPVASPANREA